MGNRLSDEQLQQWRARREKSAADSEWTAYHSRRDARRQVVRAQMVEFLSRHISGGLSTEQFRAGFDRKTRNEWDTFGLKGMSGAMFLNMLAKHLPDQAELAARLKDVLPCPATPEEGREKMQRFLSFLTALIREGKVTRSQLQTARAPFFVSTWWHVQDPEPWPPFYVSARRALEAAGLYSAGTDPVEDYFGYRDAFLALASALGLNCWETEHLCAWHDEPSGPTDEPGEQPRLDDNTNEHDDDDEGSERQVFDHSCVQFLLAKIGQKMGCHVWVALNDHGKQCNGQRLGDLSIKELPNLGLDPETRAIIGWIDILWLKGANKVVAAFEIESTTSVYSGLLRMADLVAVSPNISFPLYIVAPESRLGKVRRELSRPSFQALELHTRCSFFSNEDLAREADGILRWASDPSAMERLASRVGDVEV